VHGRAEAGRLFGLEQREGAVGMVPARLDRHLEVAQIDGAAFSLAGE
jgi:hypothetical protein